MFHSLPLPNTKLMFFRAMYLAHCRLLRIQNRVSGPYSLYSESDPDPDPALPNVLDPRFKMPHFQKNKFKTSLIFIVFFIRKNVRKNIFKGRFLPFFPDFRAIFKTWILIRIPDLASQ